MGQFDSLPIPDGQRTEGLFEFGTYTATWNDHLYFPALTADYGAEIWRTDGISVELASDLIPGPAGSEPVLLAALEYGILAVAGPPASSDPASTAIWSIDSTGAARVISEESASSTSAFLVSNGTLAWFRGIGGKLWKTDGVTAELVAEELFITPRDILAATPDALYAATAPSGPCNIIRIGVDDTVSTVTLPEGEEIGGCFWSRPAAKVEGGFFPYFRTLSGNGLFVSDSTATRVDGDIVGDTSILHDGWVYYRRGQLLHRTDGMTDEPVTWDETPIEPDGLSSNDGFLAVTGSTSTDNALYRVRGSSAEKIASVAPSLVPLFADENETVYLKNDSEVFRTETDTITYVGPLPDVDYEFVGTINGIGLFAGPDGFLGVRSNMSTAVEEHPRSKAISVYPSPTKGEVIIELPASTIPAQILVHDALGRSLRTQKLDPGISRISYDLGSAASGVYFIRVIRDGAALETRSVIVR